MALEAEEKKNSHARIIKFIDEQCLMIKNQIDREQKAREELGNSL